MLDHSMHEWSRPLAATLLATVLVAAGCGADHAGTAPDARVQERDSSGVRIVEISGGSVDTLRVGEPLLTIGEEGDPRYEFDGIRFVGGLSDGRVVVVDQGAMGVRQFTREGTYLGALGGEGEGPGEYRWVAGAQLLSGDTLVIDDSRLRRVSFVGPEPAFATSLPYPSALSERPADADICLFPGFLGVMGREVRRPVFSSWGCATARGVEGPLPWRHELLAQDPESGAVSTIATLTMYESWERPGRSGPERFPPPRLAVNRRAVPWEGGLVVPSFHTHTLSVYDTLGAHRMEIRDLEPRRALTAAHRDAWAAGQDSASIAFFDGVPFPDELPAFAAALAGDGRLWAEHYDVPGMTGEHWRVYEQTGERVAVVAFPPAFELISVRDGLAFGRTRDELGIERPQVFALQW